MKRKAMLVTPELCIGCRSCQTACKAWNSLPGLKTINTGSIENPPHLTSSLYNRVRYFEKPSDTENFKWLFVNRRCMHCIDPGCRMICPSPGALFRTDRGAVVCDREKCIGCKLCIVACPFNIPRYDKDNKLAKCHLCEDRTAHGLNPACSTACPTGALRYGDREELIGEARKKGYQKVYGDKELGGLGTLYALRHSPEEYGLVSRPVLPENALFWNSILKPLSYWFLAGAIVAPFLHYLIVGPRHGEKEERVVNEDGKND